MHGRHLAAILFCAGFVEISQHELFFRLWPLHDRATASHQLRLTAILASVLSGHDFSHADRCDDYRGRNRQRKIFVITSEARDLRLLWKGCITFTRFPCLIVAVSALIIAISAPLFSVSLQAQSPDSTKTAAPQSTQPQSSPRGARGKKLILKDGSFHMVREYEIKGDRVRYYSVERSSWEEMPSDLVDWDATKQAELAESKENATLLEKVHKDEVQRKTIAVDIDASVEVAPNLFLPEGEGLFLLDHSAITELKQSDTDIAFDKKQFLKKVLIPVPVVPTRHTVSILGTRATLRITNTQPEFYRRTKDGHEPEIYLIRAHVRNGKREVEHIDTLFDVEMAKRKPISVQTWELEKGLYRLTLSEPLDPGEFALVEVAHAESNSIYVWDFGVDPGPTSK